ncbi:uncharacterized protein EAF02_002393 [Botrytis sinoallii]|uniref:uncharacterized protein n=1 Tax=Botrytis sinoallii TaxID=1463999 RepID=UPI001901EA9F|nr:uncharacterized protein EAF02_002393 [Botrytis sinoallii]KAF7889978.1 hypothetical protein EAF02_002393 [Botrytis sinoallii]
MSNFNRDVDLPGFFLGRGTSEYRKDIHNKSQMINHLNWFHNYGDVTLNQINAIETWLQSGATGSIEDHYNPRKRGSSPPPAPRVTKRARTIKRARRVVREEQVVAPDPQLKECSICAEELALADFPDRITAGCAHDSSCCNGCLSQSICVQIETIQWDQLACPECPELLSFDNVKSFASEADFIRTLSYLISVLIQSSQTVLGPNCGNGQIHQDGDAQPIMTCGTCSFKTCFTHKMPWHTGLTCGQYDVQQRGKSKKDKKSERLIKKATKPCPNCQVPILKNKGCDHMTCTHCDYEFCWLCMADYERILETSNAAHELNCFHYRPDGSRGPRYT